MSEVPLVSPLDPTSLSDQELVQASLREPKAYALIVRRYERPLKRYVSRLLKPNSEHAEDVLQEVFIKAYVNLNDYDQKRRSVPSAFGVCGPLDQKANMVLTSPLGGKMPRRPRRGERSKKQNSRGP